MPITIEIHWLILGGLIILVAGVVLGVVMIAIASAKLEKIKIENWKLKPIEPDIDHCKKCGKLRRDSDGRWILRCPYCNDYQPFLNSYQRGEGGSGIL